MSFYKNSSNAKNDLKKERKRKNSEKQGQHVAESKIKRIRSSDVVCCSSERNVRGGQKFWVDVVGILKEELEGKNKNFRLCLDSGKESEVMCCVKQ